RKMVKNLGWPGVLLVLALVVITYFFTGEDSSSTDDSGEYTLGEFHEVSIDQLIHGDTTRFNFEGSSERFRYLIIDTPEVNTDCGSPQPYGGEAADRAEEVLTQADKIGVECDEGPTTDDYDRYLAYVCA